MTSACVDVVDGAATVQLLNGKGKTKTSDTFIATANALLRVLGLSSRARPTTSTNKQQKNQRPKNCRSTSTGGKVNETKVSDQKKNEQMFPEFFFLYYAYIKTYSLSFFFLFLSLLSILLFVRS